MTRALLIFFYCLLFTVHSSYAQKIRFTDTSNKWYCISKYLFSDFWVPVKSSIVGSTIQNGVTYSIYRSAKDSALIKFDTITNRVYAKLYIDQYYGADTNEFVLYDFSLNVGDSFKTPYFNYIVRNKDSILINGVKHYLFQIENSNRTLNIIEGIGSVEDPLMPYIGFLFEAQQRLVCFKNKNSFPILSSPYTDFDNYTTCSDTNGLGVENIFYKQAKIKIIPNPANESSRIVFPYAIPSGSVVITNMMGQVMMQKEIMNKEEVELGMLPSGGIYFCRIVDARSGNNWTRQFVYQ